MISLNWRTARWPRQPRLDAAARPVSRDFDAYFSDHLPTGIPDPATPGTVRLSGRQVFPVLIVRMVALL
jgi:hypothetical protein